jgi:hypothetical protein
MMGDYIMKRFNEKIGMYLDLHIEAKRSTLRKFIDDTVRYFTSRNYVPTFEQVYDYITTDRWAKANLYNGSNCYTQQRDFECLSIEDMCENIINLCSFNLADVYESKMSRTKKLRINESRRFSSPSDAAEYFYNDYANYGGEEIKRFFKDYSYSYDDDFISDTYSILSDMYDDEMQYDSEHDYDWDD